MAYLREIPKRSCQCCPRPAAVELINRYNASCGFFCRSCGTKEEKKLQEREGKPYGEVKR